MSSRRPRFGQYVFKVSKPSRCAGPNPTGENGVWKRRAAVSVSVLAFALLITSTGPTAYSDDDPPILSESHLGSPVQAEIDPDRSESRIRKPDVDGGLPILSESHLSSAVQVQIDPRCSESRFRKPDVTVSWKIDDGVATKGLAPKSFLEAEDVRVDIASAPGGLDIGRFKSVMVSSNQALSANKSYKVDTEATTVRFLDLSPGVIYHVRVLVLTESGWVPSAPTRFHAPVCPVDGLENEGEVGQ